MLRLFLYVLAWPVGLVLLLSLHGWMRTEFPAPPAEPAARGAVRSPAAQHQARAVLERFERLTPAEQQALAARLRAVVRPLDAWFERLDRGAYSVVCLGEFHAPATRRFVAEVFLPRYAPDVLLLEATPPELARMRSRTAAARPYVPLLGADIAAVLRAAEAARPGVIVRGIEETAEQVRTRRGREGSRDHSLARNFWLEYRPGARHVILCGALHCTDDAGWLYRLLQEQSPPREALRMLSVQVLGVHQHGPLEAFATFLGALGMGADGFAIVDTGRVPPLVRDWFGLLDQQVLGRVDALVVFRRPAARDGARQRGAGRGDPPRWMPAGAAPGRDT